MGRVRTSNGLEGGKGGILLLLLPKVLLLRLVVVVAQPGGGKDAPTVRSSPLFSSPLPTWHLGPTEEEKEKRGKHSSLRLGKKRNGVPREGDTAYMFSGAALLRLRGVFGASISLKERCPAALSCLLFLDFQNLNDIFTGHAVVSPQFRVQWDAICFEFIHAPVTASRG